jgi:hypothetical protein
MWIVEIMAADNSPASLDNGELLTSTYTTSKIVNLIREERGRAGKRLAVKPVWPRVLRDVMEVKINSSVFKGCNIAFMRIRKLSGEGL